jgi:hypothetical protein
MNAVDTVKPASDTVVPPGVPPAFAQVIDTLSAPQALALTMWAEARARLEPRRGWVVNPVAAMADIANIVANRARDPRWRGLDVKAICLARAQFSCWLPHAGVDANHDPAHLADNFEALMQQAQHLIAGEDADATLHACLEIASVCADGALRDRLGGATHYYATWAAAPAWAAPPARCVAERWGHRFFAAVR